MAPSIADLPAAATPPSEQTYTPPQFNPAKHLCYTPPTSTITLADLHLNPSTATSPTAITQPFPLLSPLAVRSLRADIFRPTIISKYASWKYPGVYRVRGYGPGAPFTYSLWKSEEIRRACSDAAGTELEVIFDYEIGQVNVQLPSPVDKTAGITENLPPPDPPSQSAGDVTGELKQETEKALVSAWHRDSYPWVCVLLLSDPTNMKGGETALRTGDPETPIAKIRAPACGWAVMMQGGSIEHAALPCLGDGERITFVTSFRSRNAQSAGREVGSLRTVRPISRLDGLYADWCGTRLGVLGESVREMQGHVEALRRQAREGVEGEEETEEARREGCKRFNGKGGEEIRELMKVWVREQMGYLERTLEEIS